jgi:hypothetical protein
MNDDWFLIVEVRAEGGAVGLAGRQDDAGAWAFRLASLDGPIVGSWEEGLQLFDRYPWAELEPIYVRPDFRNEVLDAVRARRTHRLREWQRVVARHGALSKPASAVGGDASALDEFDEDTPGARFPDDDD